MQIKRHKDKTKNLLYLSGGIDEEATEPLSRLANILSTEEWTLDLGGITMVNSIGIVGWLAFIKELQAKVVLDRVPLVIVDTAAMIEGFLGNATMANVECAYFCQTCMKEFRQFRPLDRNILTFSSLCPSCGKESEPTTEAYEVLEDLIP